MWIKMDTVGAQRPEIMMSEEFSRIVHIGWRDLDANGHMKNTAYLDKAGDLRIMYFMEQGLSLRDFGQLRISLIALRDEIDYYRELRLLEPTRITLILAGMSEDASLFRVRNEFFREDGILASRVTSSLAWFDLSARKLICPPENVAKAVRALARTVNFEKLSSITKS
jgi:acyl-CoA thioester hydrolase